MFAVSKSQCSLFLTKRNETRLYCVSLEQGCACAHLCMRVCTCVPACVCHAVWVDTSHNVDGECHLGWEGGVENFMALLIV